MNPSAIDQVRALLELETPVERMRALRHRREEAPAGTLVALVRLLEHPEERIRRRAGSGLSNFSKLHGGEVTVEIHADSLARILVEGKDERVRLSCAIALMPIGGSVVDQAFLQALADSSEKVVQLACLEMSTRGGPEAVEALLGMLVHPSWRVRLEVCKALIIRKVADPRMVAALVAMSREPEAMLYDAEVEEFDADMKEFMRELLRTAGADESTPETWGKLDMILAKARAVVDSR